MNLRKQFISAQATMFSASLIMVMISMLIGNIELRHVPNLYFSFCVVSGLFVNFVVFFIAVPLNYFIPFRATWIFVLLLCPVAGGLIYALLAFALTGVYPLQVLFWTFGVGGLYGLFYGLAVHYYEMSTEM